MSKQATIEFEYDGAMEVATSDQHQARQMFAQQLNAVLQEIQNDPTIDLNQLEVSAKLVHIEDVGGSTRGSWLFKFTCRVVLSSTDTHDARHELAGLEQKILDEVTNWPTTEIRNISVSGRLDSP